jgi:integrase
LVKELKKHKARQAEEILSGVYDKESNLVFTTEFGTPLEPRNFYRKHSRILEKANLRHVRFHDLRHSFATVLLQAGENPENLRDLLGHSKTSTTMDIYSHSTVEGKERAISRLSQIIQA